MKIIAFVGLPLSGKTTAARVAEEMGIPVVVMGDIVREEVRKRGLELNDENAGKVASELRAKEGMDTIAKRCVPKIREKLSEHGVVVIDGIRGIAEVEHFRKVFGEDFVLINIESPLEIRFQRSLSRKREDDISTIEELKRRDERELSWSMEEAMKAADFTVENLSDLETFREKIRDLLRHIAAQVEIEIETQVNPTEDVDRVVEAVKNLFPDADVEIDDQKLLAKARSLERFRELLRRQRILDTARAEMRRGLRGREITILLNKQTAVVSRINFVEDDAVLGPIVVRFRLNWVSPERFIDYVAPQTRDGKPVKELEVL